MKRELRIHSLQKLVQVIKVAADATKRASNGAAPSGYMVG